MKKFIAALVMVIALSSFSANALDHTTINTILKKFGTENKTAKDIKWTNTDEFLVIEFKLDDRIHFAYYNQYCEQVVLAKPISKSELNSRLVKELDQKYADYTITDVYILKDGEGQTYSAVAQKNDEKIILSSKGRKWETANRL